jgi:ribosome-binding protein aMBF1 (putative translation factor)
MSPEQCRAARAWLGWSQRELAKRAELSSSTVRDFEARQRVPIVNNLNAIRRALESAGIQFTTKGIEFRELASPKARSPPTKVRKRRR